MRVCEGQNKGSLRRKRICYLVDFDVSTDHRVSMKESEKIEKYYDLA